MRMDDLYGRPSAYAVLVVDDGEMNRDLLSRRLKKVGHQVQTACNGAQALDLVRRRPFDLVLLDIMMPGIDGYRVLRELKADERLRHIPVIMITSLHEVESAARCIELGADDYLPKPFNPLLLAARVNACLERKRAHDLAEGYRRQVEEHNTRLEEQVRRQVRSVTSAQLATIFAMSKLAESRDPETGAHLERMREYCRLIGTELAKSPRYAGLVDEVYIETMYMASTLHDIGKVGVPDQILLKQGPLDATEWRLMKTHPAIGADTLRLVDREHPGNALVRMGIDIAASHHEKWDGSGYPRALAGEAIPLAARILALGDVYDALTSRRCYKPAFSHEKSREMVLEGRGSHFDPEVVDAFLAVEAEFPKVRACFSEPGE